jgi:hypothetical protein
MFADILVDDDVELDFVRLLLSIEIVIEKRTEPHCVSTQRDKYLVNEYVHEN